MDLFPEVTPNGKAHSKIGASSMYRWSKCPGSVRLCEGIKSVSSVYADEGTRAHELAASLLGAQSGHWPRMKRMRLLIAFEFMSIS